MTEPTDSLSHVAEASFQRRGRFRLPLHAFLAGVALVAVLAVAGAIGLQENARQHRQLTVVLAHLFGEADKVIGSQWAAIDCGLHADSAFMCPPDPLGALDAALDGLALAGTNGRAPQAVQEAINDYLATVGHVRELMAAGEFGPAQALAITEGEPSYDRLLGEMAHASTRAADQALTADRVAEVGTIVVVGLATVMIGFLFWRFQQARRAAEFMEMEQRALRQSEARFRPLVQNSSDIITVIDADTTIRYHSPSIKRVLGYEAPDLVGRRLSDLIQPEDQPRVLAFLGETTEEPGRIASIEARFRHQDGSGRYVELLVSNLMSDPYVGGLVINARDVSERKALEEQLRYRAFHDALTDLPNRARFVERLEVAAQRAHRRGSSLAVLFIDLDNFKTVNDSLGHEAGDQLLVDISSRVRACLRPEDTAARLGGDEFAILLEGGVTPGEACVIAERVIRALSAPFTHDGKQVSVGASVGVAVSDGGPREAETLLRDADVAMYVAKSHGKGRYEVYNPSMLTPERRKAA